MLGASLSTIHLLGGTVGLLQHDDDGDCKQTVDYYCINRFGSIVALPCSKEVHSAVFGFQTRTVLSADAVTMVLPSGVKIPAVSASPWPAKRFIDLPLTASHM
jgi:hypothetical protein